MPQKNKLAGTPKKSSPKKGLLVKRDDVTPDVEKIVRLEPSFPIVGIGASAGELEALRESEERNLLLQGILRSTSDGILAVNRENEVLFANERFVEMWMIPQELMALKDDTLLLQYVLDQLSDPQNFLQKVQELYNSAEESLDTLYFKDGRVFDRLSRPMLQGMELRGRVWSFRDITERKRAEEALRRAEENYRNIFENSLNGIFQSTPEGRFITVNPTLARIWGYESPEDLLASVSDTARQVYVDPDRRNQHTRLLKEQGGSLAGFEYRAYRKDGTTIWVSENVRSVVDSDNALLYYEGSVEDISERKQAEAALQKRNEYLAALQRIAIELLDRTDVKSLLETICEKAASLLDAQHGFIFLDDGDSLLLRAATESLAHHIDEREKKPGAGVLGQVWRTGKPIRVEYYETWELRDPNYSNDKLRAAAGVPILRGEFMVGVLVIARMEEDNRVFSDDEMDILSHFAELASLVLDNVSLYESALNEIAERKSAQEAVSRAEQRYRELFEDAPAMYVITRNVEGSPVIANCNELFSRTLGFSRDELLGRPVSDLYSPASRVLLLEGGYQRALAGEFLTEERELLARDGRIVPTMVSAVPEVDVTGRVSGTRAMFVDISERKQAEEELRRAKDALENVNLELQESLEREKVLACTDGLTGLYNRRYIFELAAREFQAAVRHQRPLTFLMFDLDDFKQVNDTLGHTTGDKLLQMVAQTAVAQVRGSDVVARYGGDEFIVLLPHASAQQALSVAERIRASVAAIRVETDKEPFAFTLSIGIAETRHEPADENVERVIQRADDALYKAKRSGRNRTMIFGLDETGAI